MLPVQPTPITTASTSFKSVAMTGLSLDPYCGLRGVLREVRDRARRLVVFLAEIGLDLLAIGGGQSRIADHPPGNLVAVAAIDRIGEEAFHGDLQERVEEHVAGKARKLRLAGFHRLERRLALGCGQAVEVLAVGLARPLVGGG